MNIFKHLALAALLLAAPALADVRNPNDSVTVCSFVSSKSKSMCNICSEGKSGLANEKTLSLINTKTGKYIIPPLTENIHKLYQKGIRHYHSFDRA